MLPTFTKYETWGNTVSLNFSKPVSQHVYLRQEIKLIQDTQVTWCWYDSSPPSCLFLYLLFTLQSQEEEEKSQTVCSTPAAPHPPEPMQVCKTGLSWYTAPSLQHHRHCRWVPGWYACWAGWRSSHWVSPNLNKFNYQQQVPSLIYPINHSIRSLTNCITLVVRKYNT